MNGKRYCINQYGDGTIDLFIEGNDSFISLTKFELKELIQDLLQCLKYEPNVAGMKNKS